MPKKINERIKEFVEYHKYGDGECNKVVLKEWADQNSIDLQSRFDLAYFYTITYCVPSAILIFRHRQELMKDTEDFAERYKNIVIFESDRKYVKYLNRFQQVLDGYKKYGNVDLFLDGIRNSDGKINLQKAIEKCEEWPRFGRFCAFLFLETFVGLCQFDIENTTIDWKHGATATSGILNVFGADSAADKFDKTGKFPEGMTKEILDKMLFTLIGKIENAGGSTNVTEIETSLCAYRKFYKGTRYNGYYLDRMLENIIEIGEKYPEIERELLQIRAKKFKEKSLGEFSGWQGIRKEKKKEYINTGKIDVEYL